LRGIRAGSLTNFTPLIVLVGPNGSGKSTILDALLIAANPRPPEGIGQAVERREGLIAGARWLLWKAGNEGRAEITVRTDSGVRTCIVSIAGLSEDHTSIAGKVLDRDEAGRASESDITTVFQRKQPYGASGYFQPLDGVSEVRFLDPRAAGLRAPLHQLYTRVVEQGLQKDVVATIRTLIPAIVDMQILAEGDVPVVYLIFSGYALPAVLAGDGIRLLLHLTCELATRPGGLVLMEEPEVHLHPGAIRQCARAILAAVRRNIQIVLSTHSLELMDALLGESSDADLAQLSLYRLQLQAGTLKSSRLSGPDVAFSRSQIEDDLR
jgi:energy-coupling factor transporter ATP-binding protein EcfA2